MFQLDDLKRFWPQGDPAWITADGDLRTFPFHMPHTEARLGGMDGFFVARFVKP